MAPSLNCRQPVLRRLDHLICEVADIRLAMRTFVDRLGFPEAWPIGRFWPQGLTSGVALGGVNLEFIQLDAGAPEVARISTLVFEPTDLESAAAYYAGLGIPMELRDKWEHNPDLLRLRGFSEEDARSPQRICRNLLPAQPAAIDFFLCEYVPMLRQRLGPEAFPGLPAVREVVVAATSAQEDLEALIPLAAAAEPKIAYKSGGNGLTQVVGIRTDRGPIDLHDWPAEFRFF